MSELINQSGLPYEFPNAYPPAPVDQLGAEADLRQSITDQFPDSLAKYDSCIHSLEYFSSKDGSSVLLSEGFEGQDITEGLPLDATAMIGGIYAMTGAEIVRQDTENRGETMLVLRKSTYNGENVFFEEAYHSPGQSNTSLQDKPAFKWLIHGNKAAESILNTPTSRERAEFERISGRKFLLSDEFITRENYKQVAREIAFTDAAKQAVHDQERARRKHHSARLELQNAKKIAAILAEEERLLGSHEKPAGGLTREQLAEAMALRNREYSANHLSDKHKKGFAAAQADAYIPASTTGFLLSEVASGVHLAAGMRSRGKLKRAQKKAARHFKKHESAYIEQARLDSPEQPSLD